MLYRITQWLSWPLFTLFFRFRSRGGHHVPARGGCVIAANHASYLDPLLIGAALPHRRVGFMAKEELFRFPVFGWAIRSMGAIPVRRGGITPGAFRAFAGLLRDEGRVLVVFPEGTRTPDGRLGPGRRGVGAICLVAGVPVVPAYVTGSYAAWPRWRWLPRWGRFEVRFGAPLQWADRELEATGDPSDALATLMMNAIAQLEHPPVLEPSLRFLDGVRHLRRSRPSVGDA